MNEGGQDSTSSEASPADPPRQSAGARLTAERCNLGLSLGDIARQLKLSVRQVEALERDDYAAFAGPVFVRGFLRNYARLLNLDPDELIAVATPARVAAVAAPVEAAEERQAATPERSRRVLMSAVIGALVVIALVLLASNAARDRHSDAPANDTPALQQPPAPLAQAEPPAVSPPAPASRADVTAPPPATAAVAAPPPSSGTPAPAQSAPLPEVTKAATEATEGSAKPHILVSGNGPAQVHMVFEGESWVEVRDANGTTIFSRLNSPGTERLIRGTPPLALVVGNASSVKLLYHNKEVDLQPHTRVDVARITLE
jgi:cytoskeleton protein RodZ